MAISPQVDGFFKRVKENADALRGVNKVPAELAPLISKSDLQNIYDAVIGKQGEISEKLEAGKPYRLEKKGKEKTERTFNIVFEPGTGEIQLILETKSKVLNVKGETQKGEIPVSSGTSKSTKPAWRIDTPQPVKMANAVYYAPEEEYMLDDLKQARHESELASEAVKGGADESKKKFINVTTEGEEIIKEGIRKYNGQMYYAKQSHYSTYALCDLHTMLKNPDKYPLNDHDRDDMAKTLLEGLKLLHDKGIIHQDIKPENILVYKNEKGQYYLALTDFGLSLKESDKDKRDALATLGYESPEISAAHLYNRQSSYFHSRKYPPSFAAETMLANVSAYEKKGNTNIVPDKSNDMWAVGMVLKELYSSNRPHSLPIKEETQLLINGLLAPFKENRTNVNDAVKVFETVPERAPAPMLLSKPLDYLRENSAINKEKAPSQPVQEKREDTPRILPGKKQ